jgi:hypothetical protein
VGNNFMVLQGVKYKFTMRSSNFTPFNPKIIENWYSNKYIYAQVFVAALYTTSKS